MNYFSCTTIDLFTMFQHLKCNSISLIDIQNNNNNNDIIIKEENEPKCFDVDKANTDIKNYKSLQNLEATCKSDMSPNLSHLESVETTSHQDPQSESEDNSLKSKDAKTYKCKLCDYTTLNNTKFKYHFLEHNSNARIYQCDHCPFITRHWNVIENHKVLHLNPDEVEWYSCEFCTFRSKFRGNIDRHLNTHNKTKEKK